MPIEGALMANQPGARPRQKNINYNATHSFWQIHDDDDDDGDDDDDADDDGHLVDYLIL